MLKTPVRILVKEEAEEASHMETLSKRRVEAIIAFYNLFCEKMVLEECKDLPKTRYLLHSVVEFIDTGTLAYQTHENFGFQETVDFLKDHLDATLTDCLNAELAETEDPLEIAKILVALLYTFRLELTEEIVAYVNELPPKLNSEIAAIIQYLDDEELQNSSADVLALILTTAGALDASSTLASATMNSSALLNLSSSPMRRSPLIDICNNSLRLNAKRKSSAAAASTPQTAKPREVVFGMDASSPITAVINSPRGANVTRIKKQQRRIGELKEQMEALRHQCDQLEDECASLRDKLLDAEKDSETLLKRNKRVETELRRQFEETLAGERAELKKLRAELKKSGAEIERLNACQLELRFDKDGALNEAKIAEEVNKTLSECLDEMRGRLRDQTETLSFTRERQIEAENRARDYEMRFREVCELHRQEISDQQLRAEHLLAQKDDDFRKQLETTLLVQANYKTQVDELSARLSEANAKCEELETMKFEAENGGGANESALALEKSEIAKLQNAMDEKEVLVSELQDENAKLRGENTTLRASLSEMNNRFKNLEENNVESCEENDQLKQRLKELSDANANLKARLDCNAIMDQWREGGDAQSAKDSPKPPTLATTDDELADHRLSFYSARSRPCSDIRQFCVSPAASTSSVTLYHEQENVMLYERDIDQPNALLAGGRIVEVDAPVESRHFVASAHKFGSTRSATGGYRQRQRLSFGGSIGGLMRRVSTRFGHQHHENDDVHEDEAASSVSTTGSLRSAATPMGFGRSFGGHASSSSLARAKSRDGFGGSYLRVNFDEELEIKEEAAVAVEQEVEKDGRMQEERKKGRRSIFGGGSRK